MPEIVIKGAKIQYACTVCFHRVWRSFPIENGTYLHQIVLCLGTTKPHEPAQMAEVHGSFTEVPSGKP